MKTRTELKIAASVCLVWAAAVAVYAKWVMGEGAGCPSPRTALWGVAAGSLLLLLWLCRLAPLCADRRVRCECGGHIRRVSDVNVDGWGEARCVDCNRAYQYTLKK